MNSKRRYIYLRKEDELVEREESIWHTNEITQFSFNNVMYVSCDYKVRRKSPAD